MKKEITVLVDPEGNTSVDLTGFHGKGCHEVMQDFTAPGDKLKRMKIKREYHEATAQEKERVKAGGKA